MNAILDLWFEEELKKELDKETPGYTEMVRYADDFVIGAQTKVQAEKILEKIKARLKKFGLEISEEKTKIIEFGPIRRRE